MESTGFGLGVRIKRLVRPFFGIFAAVFVVLVVKDMATKFNGLTLSIKWSWVLLALLPTILAVLFQYQAWWALVLSWTQRRMPRALSLRVYVDGQMARYTPGKVGLPAVRVAGAPLLGVSAQIMLTSLLTEVLAWSACGSILGGLVVYARMDRFAPSGVASEFLGYLGMACSFGLIVLVVLPRRFLPAVLARLLGVAGSGPLMPWRVPLWQSLHFVASALAGACVAFSLGCDYVEGFYLGAVVCVAIVAGFLALLAPAGVGVREAVIAVFAEPVLGVSGAIALGLLARAVSLAAELMLFALFRFITRRKSAQPGTQGS